ETLPSLKEFNKWDSPFVKYFANNPYPTWSYPYFLTWIFDLLNKKNINRMFYKALEVIDKDSNAPEELRTAVRELIKKKRDDINNANYIWDDLQQLIQRVLAEKENHVANVIKKKKPTTIIKTQFVPKLKWSMKASSGNSIYSDVEKILLNFRDLFIKCKNEKLELPNFNPNENHPHFKEIRNLYLPLNPLCLQPRPSLLVYNLSMVDENGGITNTLDLEKISQIKECLVVLGTSGS
ncbi:16674_t:CDS:2, partial [Racocetra persica]